MDLIPKQARSPHSGSDKVVPAVAGGEVHASPAAPPSL